VWHRLIPLDVSMKGNCGIHMYVHKYIIHIVYVNNV
jgi:hypothetical protein